MGDGFSDFSAALSCAPEAALDGLESASSLCWRRTPTRIPTQTTATIPKAIRTYFKVLDFVGTGLAITVRLCNFRRTCVRYCSSAKRCCSSSRMRCFCSSESSIYALKQQYRAREGRKWAITKGNRGSCTLTLVQFGQMRLFGPSVELFVLALAFTSTNVAWSQTAKPTVTAVTNVASYANGSISPGEMVVIFGSGMGPSSVVLSQLDQQGRIANALSQVQVLFDGNPAPLIYVSAK